MARKKHEAEKKHALRKKEAPPVQDMPDETEHPALSEEKKPRVSKLLYRIIAALLIGIISKSFFYGIIIHCHLRIFPEILCQTAVFIMPWFCSHIKME